MTQLPPKDPSATRTYGVLWSDVLHAEGLTLASSTWTNGGLVIENEDLLDAETKKVSPGTLVPSSLATVLLSGGIADSYYQLTNHVIFDNGEEDERRITIRVEER